MAKPKLTKDQKRKKKLDAEHKKELRALNNPQQWKLEGCYCSGIVDFNEDELVGGAMDFTIHRSHQDKHLLATIKVNLLCAGVYDAFSSTVLTQEDAVGVLERIAGIGEGFAKCSIEFCVDVINTSIAYAAKFDLHPDAGFHKAKRLLSENFETQEVQKNILCGNEEGKPVWVPISEIPPLTSKQRQLIEAAGGEIILEEDMEELEQDFASKAGVEQVIFGSVEALAFKIHQDDLYEYSEKIVARFQQSTQSLNGKVHESALQFVHGIQVPQHLIRECLSHLGCTLDMPFDLRDILLRRVPAQLDFGQAFEGIAVCWHELHQFWIWLGKTYPQIPKEIIEPRIALFKDTALCKEFIDACIDPDFRTPMLKMGMALSQAKIDPNADEEVARKLLESFCEEHNLPPVGTRECYLVPARKFSFDN